MSLLESSPGSLYEADAIQKVLFLKRHTVSNESLRHGNYNNNSRLSTPQQTK